MCWPNNTHTRWTLPSGPSVLEGLADLDLICVPSEPAALLQNLQVMSLRVVSESGNCCLAVLHAKLHPSPTFGLVIF